jgi:hypothetical protein
MVECEMYRYTQRTQEVLRVGEKPNYDFFCWVVILLLPPQA